MEETLKKKIWAIGLVSIGVAAIVFAIICFCHGFYFSGSYVYHITYGGDAYTGIQNAAADTANNVKYLGSLLSNAAHFSGVCTGFLLLVVGALLLLVGILKGVDAFTKKNIVENEAGKTEIISNF